MAYIYQFSKSSYTHSLDSTCLLVFYSKLIVFYVPYFLLRISPLVFFRFAFLCFQYVYIFFVSFFSSYSLSSSLSTRLSVLPFFSLPFLSIFSPLSLCLLCPFFVCLSSSFKSLSAWLLSSIPFISLPFLSLTLYLPSISSPQKKLCLSIYLSIPNKVKHWIF